jgi:hypothetical protein
MLDGELVEIQNGLATVYRKETVRQVSLDALMKTLSTGSGPVTLPTIARSQVFAHLDTSNRNSKKLFIMSEIPAGITNITINNRDRSGARRYRLSMPWTYLWFMATTGESDITRATWSIEDYRVFHARDQYKGVDDEMIVARLPNVYGDGRICWGATGTSPNMSLADRIDALTNGWYLSRFNHDLDGSVPLPQNEPNYRRWVQESRGNVAAFRSWPEWNDRDVTKYSVRSLLLQSGTEPFIEEIHLPNAIPEVPTRLTFLRAEEFWNSLSPENRLRLDRALQNLRDNPDFFAGAEEILNAEVDPEDDGGVPVPMA